jgi:EAL and modified HD-GYP domain-containing signal transduction protein
MSVYLGRQPILDGRRRRRGYELLYRSDNMATAFFTDPDDATRSVVERALLEWGLDNLVGRSPAYINVTAEFLHSGLMSILPPDKVVLELLETVEFDERTLSAVRHGVRRGYRFALDDVVSVGNLEPVLPYVEVVKVEVLSMPDAESRALVSDLRAIAPHARLLAEKVETLESFEHCSELGFDLFQGYFFARPEIVERQARPIGQHTALMLMTAVQDPHMSFARLAELANTDPTLTYRLLRLVNAISTGLLTRIESVHQAIVLLGMEHVRQLATLLTLAANATNNRELITLAVMRAHMASHLLAGRPEAASAFTAGLLSVIDVVFQTTMNELVEELPIADDVAAALIHGTGLVGEALAIVRAHETGDIRALLASTSFPMAAIHAAAGDAALTAAKLEAQIQVLTTGQFSRPSMAMALAETL